MNKGDLMDVRHNNKVVGQVPWTGDPVVDSKAARGLIEALGLSRPALDRWQRIRFQAQHFTLTADHLWKTAVNVGPTRGSSAIPFVVLSVFAVELYLKAMLARSGITAPRTHDLLRLFRHLSDRHKQHLGEVAANRPQLEPHTRDVEEMLAKLRNAFEQWRYVFEADAAASVNFPELIFLLQLLETATSEDAPSGAD